ncbi:FAD:protein FMN transferase [Marinovum sp.]|uniref:FAD:protein FMN transferase n=1 Tax=Marinovum sp. TaxID=2024839 RepID=UPI002B274742|nr:FAD:protein FMN transferase [Marinovum sp.]
MRPTRRRFLAIAAGFAATPAMAQRHSWRGRAFGAEIAIVLQGSRAQTGPALQAAQRVIAEVEAMFSLYQPSDLVRLNRAGWLVPAPRFLALMQAADRAHRLTGGLFDPTVQPLWSALSRGEDPAAAAALIGWDRLRFSAEDIRLAPGQALTFNGIAQGFATDLVAEALAAQGVDRTLINIGEFRAGGGPYRLGLADPLHGALGAISLSDGAVATSSPLATPLGETGHILHPRARPLWSSVTVEAETAVLADALSTALVLAPLEQVREVRRAVGVRRVLLVDPAGDLTSL